MINTTIIKLAKSAIFGAVLAMPFGADAIRARQGDIIVSQPDGTQLTIRLEGDERDHSVFTSDGYLLVADANGVYNYATLDGAGGIIDSGIAASDARMRSASARAFLKNVDSPAIYQALQQRAEARMAEQAAHAPADGMKKGIGLCKTSFPLFGTPKALVILVEYQDVKFTTENPQEYFDRMFNEEGFSDYEATGSCRDYFVENSMGQFAPDFDIIGPVELPKNMKYYGGNDARGNDSHPEDMVIHACQALDDEIDFSQYDTDGDGYIDNIYIYYAGYGEADGGSNDTVWPHSWDLDYAGKHHTFDGVKLNHYACSNEIDFATKRPDGIGTFVHEFSHVLGLPDLYATTYTSSFTPGPYNVLDYGPYNNEGRTPPQYSAFERLALGWMEPEVLDNTMEGTFSLLPVDTSNHAYIIWAEEGKEYFLLESRKQQSGDTYIPNHGMLIWHVDFVQSIWDSNSVNNTPSHQYVDIVEADNIKSENSRRGDVWPGTKNKTEFTPESKPAFKNWARKDLGISITEITEDEEQGLITFHFKGVGSGVREAAGERGWTISGTTVAAGSEAVEVFDIAGRRVAGIAAGATRELPRGLYIVKGSKGSEKVVL